MSNIEKIKAEIERQRSFIEGLFIEGDSTFYDGQDDAYNHLLAFIDSLPEDHFRDSTKMISKEQEEEIPPYCTGVKGDPDLTGTSDLEEELDNYFEGLWPGIETAEQCNTDLHFTPPAIMRLACHFAEWQKAKDDKETADLMTIVALDAGQRAREDSGLTWKDIRDIVEIADKMLDDPKARVEYHNHNEEYYYNKILEKWRNGTDSED